MRSCAIIRITNMRTVVTAESKPPPAGAKSVTNRILPHFCAGGSIISVSQSDLCYISESAPLPVCDSLHFAPVCIDDKRDHGRDNKLRPFPLAPVARVLRPPQPDWRWEGRSNTEQRGGSGGVGQRSR